MKNLNKRSCLLEKFVQHINTHILSSIWNLCDEVQNLTYICDAIILGEWQIRKISDFNPVTRIWKIWVLTKPLGFAQHGLACWTCRICLIRVDFCMFYGRKMLKSLILEHKMMILTTKKLKWQGMFIWEVCSAPKDRHFKHNWKFVRWSSHF